jgi:hypothetical protein
MPGTLGRLLDRVEAWIGANPPALVALLVIGVVAAVALARLVATIFDILGDRD